MPRTPPRIAIVGTFDVQNYGDLLFPILARHALEDRLGAGTDVIAYSYGERRAPGWPYDVRSVSTLADEIDDYDALLVGGGFLIRFDHDVAPGYGPPEPWIHHPTGYWLSPALVALARDVPVVFNAPGMHCNDVPSWASDLVGAALDGAALVAVRDEPTRDVLVPLTKADVRVVPDTGFGIGRVLPDGDSDRSREIRRAIGLEQPYIVVQSAISEIEFAARLGRAPDTYRDHQIVALPVGPVLGDHPDVLGDLPRRVVLDAWPDPLTLAEVIRAASAVIGHSYHLAITAVTAGVPVFTPVDLGTGKYTALDHIGSIRPIESFFNSELPGSTMHRSVDPAVTERAEQVERHWDAVADVVRAGRRRTGPMIARMLQTIPRGLEHTKVDERELEALRQLDARRARAVAALEQEAIAAAGTVRRLEQDLDDARRRQDETLAAHAAELDRLVQDRETLREQLVAATTSVELAQEQAAHAIARVHDLGGVVDASRGLLIDTHDELLAVHRSRSWRITAPLRRVGRRLGRPAARRSTLRLRPLLVARMARDPFEWVAVDGLFDPATAAHLAATFPTDHVARIEGYGGEKDYCYAARELAPFGKAAVSQAAHLDERWRDLVSDLISPSYRRAMTALTGIDLRTAPLEIVAMHYPPGGLLDPHCDLPDKLVTHVLWFNERWRPEFGGTMRILGSQDVDDVVQEFLPTCGSSVVFVRSDRSWHAVTPVTAGAPTTRRAVTVTFHRPGASSSMWPIGDERRLGPLADIDWTTA